MARPQFSQPINVVSNLSIKVVMMEQKSSAGLGTGQVESLYFYAPLRTVGEVIGTFVEFPAVAAATTGTKRITIDVGTSKTVGLVQVTGNWNVIQSIDKMTGLGGTNLIPADAAAFSACLKATTFDDSQPFTVIFRNDTDGTTAAQRMARVYFKTTAVS